MERNVVIGNFTIEASALRVTKQYSSSPSSTYQSPLRKCGTDCGPRGSDDFCNNTIIVPQGEILLLMLHLV